MPLSTEGNLQEKKKKKEREQEKKKTRNKIRAKKV
jgi:hypothetical protein